MTGANRLRKSNFRATHFRHEEKELGLIHEHRAAAYSHWQLLRQAGLKSIQLFRERQQHNSCLSPLAPSTFHSILIILKSRRPVPHRLPLDLGQGIWDMVAVPVPFPLFNKLMKDNTRSTRIFLVQWLEAAAGVGFTYFRLHVVVMPVLLEQYLLLWIYMNFGFHFGTNVHISSSSLQKFECFD